VQRKFQKKETCLGGEIGGCRREKRSAGKKRRRVAFGGAEKEEEGSWGEKR